MENGLFRAVSERIRCQDNSVVESRFQVAQSCIENCLLLPGNIAAQAGQIDLKALIPLTETPAVLLVGRLQNLRLESVGIECRLPILGLPGFETPLPLSSRKNAAYRLRVAVSPLRAR